MKNKEHTRQVRDTVVKKFKAGFGYKKKNSFISLCLKPEMWQKVAKFKGAEYFRKALYHGPITRNAAFLIMVRQQGFSSYWASGPFSLQSAQGSYCQPTLHGL